MSDAWKQVEEWLDCENAWIPEATDRHREVLGSLLAGSGMQANLVPDAHLASLAIEHGLILCSTDGDFGRFRNLRWQDRKSTRLNSSHSQISYAVFCLKKKKKK